MSRKLVLLRPVPISAVSPDSGADGLFLLTPDPKEVWRAALGGTRRIDIDLGVAREIDAVFLGFTNADVITSWSIAATNALDDPAPVTVFPDQTFGLAGGTGRRHGIALLAAPVMSRFLRITLAHPLAASPLEAGVLAIGARFEHAYEFKSGRKPIDLSERVDLASGGFGFGAGAIKSSFRFTFSGLDDAELEELWGEIMAVGTSHPVLLLEGGDGYVSHNQVHYGVFERFEAYEREDPADSRWALSMTDWV